MQLQLPELADILKMQDGPVEVRNAHSVPVGGVSISKALELVKAGFIGVGNRRRILFLRPGLQPQVKGWLGGSNTIRRVPIRNEQCDLGTGLRFRYEHKSLVSSEQQG